MHKSLLLLFPLISEINKKIITLSKICDTKIKFRIQICNFIVEVEDAQS
jgi:hypothetical protein